MEASVLQTKLYIPLPRPELIARPRLIERLDAGLGCKLALVSAPAGFGKTTLVSEWVSHLGLANGNSGSETTSASAIRNRVAWLSLDESDNELTRFLTYLIAALQTVEADIGRGALRALESPPPPPEAILTPLLNELAAVPDRIVLVLDDYHLMEAQPIHDAITFFLRHMPPQVHLVLATREDPPLPLARLRARGQLTELRAADLRFTPAEAAAFLNQAMGLDLSAEQIAALDTRTEGWIAGLQLAAVSMQGSRDAQGFIKSFAGSHRYVLDYLVEEVLEQQPERIQTFLLQTAVLDRLNGSLCDALTRRDDGQATLEMLERANLFLIPLDNRRQWYRYHHLFADLLRQRLRQTYPDQVPALHRRASEWYEQRGMPADAIRHALAIRDEERAAALAELAWPGQKLGFQSIAWLGWVRDLPAEIVRARPVLSAAFAWAFLSAGELDEAEARMIDAERWIEPAAAMGDQAAGASSGMVVVDQEQFRGLPAWLASMRAYHAQASGDLGATARYVERALDLYPEDDHYNRAGVTGLLGLAYWASGDLHAAYRTFSEGLFQNVDDLIKGTLVLADIKMTLGHLHDAVRICERALALAAEHGNPIGTEDVHTAISALHREWGDLEAAARDLAASKKLGEQVELPDWQYRWYVARARLDESLEDLDAAVDALDAASRVYVKTPLPDVRPIAAMRARVWLKQGRLAKALAWARAQSLSADDDLCYLREFEHVTLARALIAQGRSKQPDGAIQQAVDLLQRLLQAAITGQRTSLVIEMLILQALAHEAQDRTSLALASLERALALAEPEGYARIFVDEGLPMARLLYQALSQEIAVEYVRRLLSAFPTTKSEHARPQDAQPADAGLIEPLSEREGEVLGLLAEGLTNREIATRLYLSLNTVKVHTRNIYGKLGVNNRTQAVSRARILGVLASA